MSDERNVPKAEAEADLKQTQETSLPNALPNTDHSPHPGANHWRTAGIAGAIVIVVLLLLVFGLR
ncbi:hypothetical protein K1W69_05760 [Hoeflea sp. WL0058]|uniref:Uncharacterized protein n=1 Tax=Flavimaribacter sediminis TaxID=2865987 RepID=A0AAE2ZKJ5_9HYPH|nr:hypothetical protein [Flavimaribacter sediminis]MBW8636691.1 hypothetical protein [Flavimaribacter sediminis]